MMVAAAQEEAERRRGEKAARRAVLAASRARELAVAQGRASPAARTVTINTTAPAGSQRMESEMPPRPLEFGNHGGENELADWFYSVERTMSARATPHASYAAIESFALTFVTRDVHDWFRARMLERAQEGRGALRSWDDFRALFEETYRKHNEADESVRGLLSGEAARMRAGITLTQHLTRMSGLRSRIPESIIDVSAFNEAVLAGLSDACGRTRMKVKRALAKFRKDNGGKSFSFTRLKELLFEEHMDAIDYGVPASATTRAHVAAVSVYDAKGEIAALRAQLAALSASQSAAKPTQQLHAAQHTGARRGGTPALGGSKEEAGASRQVGSYTQGEFLELADLGICIRCGAEGHIKRHCDAAKPTCLRHLLKSSK